MCTHVKTHFKPDTAVSYHSLLDNHILPVLGEMALDEVDRAEVTALHQQLRKKPTVANAAVVLLSMMFSMAEAWGLVPPGRNPCQRLLCYQSRPRERFFTEAEFNRLGCALDEVEEKAARLRPRWPPSGS